MTTRDPDPRSEQREPTTCPNCGAEMDLGEVSMKDEEGRVIQHEGGDVVCPECGHAVTTAGGPEDPLPQ